MAKFREFLAKPVVTVLLFALAIGLLAGSGIGGARAALNEQSEIYKSTVELPTVGVRLLENGAVPKEGKLLTNLLGGDKVLQPGKIYTEELSVENTGSIEEFVRVTVQKYWLNAKGEKAPAMDSSWIHLGFATDGWVIDDKDPSLTEERTVLYYTSALPAGQASTPLMKTICLDGKVAEKVTQESRTSGSKTIITTTFYYNGYQLCLKATVDAVQINNAQDAIKSAWGRSVTVSGKTLSLD